MKLPQEMANSLKNHQLDSENICMGPSDTLGHLWKKSEFQIWCFLQLFKCKLNKEKNPQKEEMTEY